MIATTRSGLSGAELSGSFTPFFGSVCAVATAILVPVGSAAPQTTGVVVSYARTVVSGRRECVIVVPRSRVASGKVGFPEE